MNTDKKDIENLEKALLFSARESKKFPVSDSWQSDVMRNIRLIGPLEEKEDTLEPLGEWAWKYIFPACAAIFIFTIAAMENRDIPSDYAIASMYGNIEKSQAIEEYLEI
jgi:hypothetical protein